MTRYLIWVGRQQLGHSPFPRPPEEETYLIIDADDVNEAENLAESHISEYTPEELDDYSIALIGELDDIMSNRKVGRLGQTGHWRYTLDDREGPLE